MNVYDSQRMRDLLMHYGYHPATDPTDAGLIIFNSCHIREKAAEKLYSEVGTWVDRTRNRGANRPLIAVIGCVAQAEGEEMRRRMRHIDIIAGPRAYHHLPELVRQAWEERESPSGQAIAQLYFAEEDKFDNLPLPGQRGPVAYLTIQEGCDKFCKFCVVPYTRGAEYSRPREAIMREAHALIAAGCCEIVLLGQNVNAWHSQDKQGRQLTLADLLYSLADLSGLARLRYTTSHPIDMRDDLIAAHGELDVLMPSLHLPVQTGSDKLLKAMGRRHDVSFYLDLITKLRRARPDIALSSDFIVGYPGESEADFQATLDLVTSVGFAKAFSFKYSPRLGTPAPKLASVSESVQSERLAVLQDALEIQRRVSLGNAVGQVQSVLVEKQGRHHGQWIGRNPWDQSVHVEHHDLTPGQLCSVNILAAGPRSLAGTYVMESDRRSSDRRSLDSWEITIARH